MPKPFLKSVHLQILLLIVVLTFLFCALIPPFQSADEPALFCALIPPFQSADEPAHVERTCLLTQGQVFLEIRPGEGAGGETDRGLLAEFGAFAKLAFHPERKMSKQEEVAAASIK